MAIGAGVAATPSNGTASPAAINAPTRAVGDLLIVSYSQDSTSRTVTTPSGWTLVDGPITSSSQRGYTYARIADNTATDNFSATISAATNWLCNMVKYSGVDTSGAVLTTAIVAHAADFDAAAVTAMLTPSLTTPALAGCVLVGLYTADATSTLHTYAPTSTTPSVGTPVERYDNNEGTGFLCSGGYDTVGLTLAASTAYRMTATCNGSEVGTHYAMILAPPSSLTAVDKTTQLLFNDRAVVNDSTQLLFNDRQAVNDGTQLLFNDQAVVNDGTQLLWNVLTGYPLVSAPVVRTTNGNGPDTLTLPAGILGGDLILVFQAINNTSSTTANTPTASGMTFTSLGTPITGGSDTLYGWYAIAAGTFGSASADAGKAVSVSTSSGTPGKYSAIAAVIDGTKVNQTTPVDLSSWTTAGYTSGASHVVPAYSTTAAVRIFAVLSDKGAPPSQNTTSQPSVAGATYVNVGDTAITSGSAIESIMMSWTGASTIPASTAVGGGTWTVSLTTTSSAVALFAINPPSSLTAVDKTTQLLFNDQAAITKTDQLLFNDRAAITKTDQLLFNDQAAITKTDQLLFNDRAAITKTDQLLFNDQAAITKTDQLLFNDLVPIVKTDQLLFNDLIAITKTDQLLFNDQAAITKTDQLLFNDLVAITKTDQLLFTDRVAINKTDQLLFSDFAAIVKTDQLLFSDLAAIVKADQLLWNVIQLPGVVTVTRQLVFNDIAALVKTDQLIFSDLIALVKARQIVFSDTVAIAKTDQLLFNDLIALVKARQLVFNDIAALVKTDQIIFNDLIALAKADQLRFSVLIPINKSRQFVWLAFALVLQSRQFVFADLDDVTITDRILFDTLVIGGVKAWNGLYWSNYPRNVWDGSVWTTV